MVSSVIADTRSLGQFNVALQLSSARAVTTTNLDALYNNGPSNNGVDAYLIANSNGALVVDGITIRESERLLVNAQSNSAFNGVYIMSEQQGDAGEPWKLQRADDFQVIAQMRAGLFIPIDEGLLLAGSIWIMDAPVPNYVGADAITFSNAAGASPQEVTPAEIQENAFIYGVNSGLTNAYALTLDPAVTAYTDGLGVIIKILSANANTGAATLNVNGLGDATIYLPDGGPLIAGSVGGSDYHMVYSTTYNGWMLLNPNPNASGSVNPGLINQVAYYAASGSELSGTGTLPPAVQQNITKLGDQSQDLNMNVHLIHNVVDPVNPQDAATKAYADAIAAGFIVKLAVRVATTTALTATYANGAAGVGATLTNADTQAALAIDGVTLSVNDRVLVKDQLAAEDPWNGIYDVTDIGSGATNWVLTRSTDYDEPSEIVPGSLVIVNEGTVNTQTSWIETATVTAIGTDPILFSAFTANPSTFIPKATVAAAGKVLRSDSSQWIASTATFADTYSASNLLYSNGANTVTGLTTANNGTLVTSNAGVPSVLAGPGTAGNLLQANAAAAPSFSTYTFPTTAGSSGSIVISNGTNKINSTSLWVNTVGSAGTIIRSDGTSNIYSTATFADTYPASSILYSNGANTVTGLGTANSSVLVTTSAGVPTQSGTMTNGQLIIGSTGATPTPATLTAGNNISITNGAGSITIAGSGFGAFVWNNVTGTSQAMAINNGYIANNAGLVTLTLPSTAAVGTVLAVQGSGAGGWLIAQNASQIVHIGSSASTTGVVGSVASSNRYDSVYLVCIVANLEWACIGGPQGILTVT